MIPIYSSALKDNEVNITDLPMPRILGEGEEEPILVWDLPEIIYHIWPNRMPDGRWGVCYTSRGAAESSPDGQGQTAYRTTLEQRLAEAKTANSDGVILIDESYTVIDSWRVQ